MHIFNETFFPPPKVIKLMLSLSYDSQCLRIEEIGNLYFGLQTLEIPKKPFQGGI